MKRNASAWGAAAGGAGAAVVATAASACCIPVLAPLVISLLGVTGAVWAAGLQPYARLILIGAGVLLGIGFWLVYRRPSGEGASCAIDRRSPVRWTLWLAAGLWGVAAAVHAYVAFATGLG